MKLTFKFLLLLLVFPLFVSSCGDDDDDDKNPAKELILSPDGEWLLKLLDDDITIEIVSGNGGYTVSSSNDIVATAKINGNEVIITSQSNGVAIITVSDKAGKTATITIEVDANPIVPIISIKFIDVDEIQTITLSKEPFIEYSVTNSDATIVSAQINGLELTIKGLKKGIADIMAVDKRGDAEGFKVFVTEPTELVFSNSNLTMYNNQSSTLYALNGKRDYTSVVVADPSIVSAEIIDLGESKKSIFIKALSQGSTTITVIEGNRTGTLNITVQ